MRFDTGSGGKPGRAAVHAAMLAALVLDLGWPGDAMAVSETFIIDPQQTRPQILYRRFGYSLPFGRFDKTSGRIVLDGKARNGAIDVTIDMNSITTGLAAADEYLKSKDCFDTAQHPVATFKSSTIRFEGGRPVRVEGNLNLKGISKPLVLDVGSFQRIWNPRLKREIIGANASATVRRSDFNTGKYATTLGDEMTLSIAVQALRE